MKNKPIQKNYDFVVIGGGLSGVCAAISASRGGVKTALIQNRPVLGGNASSEIRMHICGADNHGRRENARETGILDEILLENKYRNPQNSYSIFDTILWEKTHFQNNLDLYLNTHISDVHKSTDRIQSVSGYQLTTEKHYIFNATYFLDATGDGTIAALSGASYMIGREAKSTFNEQYAPETEDSHCMGNTLLFTTKKMDSPTPFHKPFWANTYTDADLKNRPHGAHGYNYWWIEIGGDELKTIDDTELIRDELLKALYGVWDHIKNEDHQADNYALDWVGFLPGKRESRRVIGDYILTENDLLTARSFDDAVAYGGWPMDMHVVGGLNTRLDPTTFIDLPDVYTIPYRSLYSKDIHNLLIGGRIISASHMAFGSTRVMGTCAVVGQAIGTSVRLLKEKNIMPNALGPYIQELQQMLLKDDVFIPNVVNEDSLDLAKNAILKSSSHTPSHQPENIINGISRSTNTHDNLWSASIEQPQWIEASWQEPLEINEIHLKFDSNLSQEIMLTLFQSECDIPNIIPEELVKSFSIECFNNNQLVYKKDISDNYQRFVVNQLPSTLSCDSIKITFNETHGSQNFRLFELRVY